MKKYIFLIFLITNPIFAAGVAIIDPVSHRVKQYSPATDETPYLVDPNAMIFTDQTSQTVFQVNHLLETVPLKYLKKSGSSLVEMSSNEKKSVDDEITYVSHKDAQGTAKGFKNDLVIQALIQIISEKTNTPIADIQDEIEKFIASKLKVPK